MTSLHKRRETLISKLDSWSIVQWTRALKLFCMPKYAKHMIGDREHDERKVASFCSSMSTGPMAMVFFQHWNSPKHVNKRWLGMSGGIKKPSLPHGGSRGHLWNVDLHVGTPLGTRSLPPLGYISSLQRIIPKHIPTLHFLRISIGAIQSLSRSSNTNNSPRMAWSRH